MVSMSEKVGGGAGGVVGRWSDIASVVWASARLVSRSWCATH